VVLCVNTKNFYYMFRAPEKYPFPGVIGTFMGRDAITLAVSFLGLGRSDTVLLPAYTCLEAIKPFLRTTKVVYYELGPTLAADPEDIRRKCDQHRVKMVMIINYFGFLQPGRQAIKRTCADRGIILMEDCAHSLLTEGSGETGDLTIYSYAKILPVPDGGGLGIKKGADSFRPHFSLRAFSNFLSALVIIKSAMNVRINVLSRAWLTSHKKGPERRESCHLGNPRIFPMSFFSRNAIGNSSFPEVIEKRRRDYIYWQDLSKKTDQWKPLYRDLPPGVCPLGFPIVTTRRDQMKERLSAESIHLKTHWHLPDSVSAEFVASHSLSSQTLTLPVYPDLGPRVKRAFQRMV
jgi:perosamine synthetase